MAYGPRWPSIPTGRLVAKAMPVSSAMMRLGISTVRYFPTTRLSLTCNAGYLTTNLVEGKRLRVHLWDIGGPEALFRHCNCEGTSTHMTQGYPSQRLEVAQMAVAPGWQVFNPSPPTTASPLSYPASAPIQYPASPPISPQMSASSLQPAQIAEVMARLNTMSINGPVLNPQDPAHMQYTVNWIQQRQLQQQQQQQYQAMQVQAGATRTATTYAVPPSGLPVNTSNGSIRTEARGVFVSGLSYKAKSRDIEAVFSRAGEISKCEVQKDAATGKSKGKATIRYASAAGAAQAISMFDKKKFMGMEISVRADTDRTVISPPPGASNARTNGQPIIVDGSNAPEVR
jgi:hypothetical protein